MAIVLVLAFHAALMARGSLQGAAAHLVDSVMGAGWVGVDLFFVLSGFLITGILLATKESATYYKSFFARRFLRIFPLYYLVVGLTAVWHHAIFSRLDIASLVFFYYNLQAVYLGHHLADVNSLWSLAVEEQFYIVWPTVVLLFSRRTLVRISLVGMLVALILRLIILPQATVFQSAYYLTPCRMDALLAGALLAVWRTDGEAWKRVKRFAAPAALVSSAILSGIALWTGHFYDFVTKSTVAGQHLRHSSYLVLGPGCTFLAVLFASAVVQCTEPGKVSRIFDWQPLRRIGKYSYGMYLFHWLILMILHKFGLTHIRDLPFDGSAIVCFMLLLCASFAAAFISFHVYEKHFLRLKRLFPAVAFQRETRVSR